MSYDLDPQAEGLLNMMAEQEMPPLHAVSVNTARNMIKEMFSSNDPEPVGDISDISIDGPDDEIPIRIYTPEEDGQHPAVAFFHGGGWALGNLDTDDHICRALANRANCVVVSAGYRLAPENPFPASLIDSYAVTKWISEYGASVGADPDRIVVAGDSTGGNLAAAVALLARDRGSPKISHQLLIYPQLNAPQIKSYDSYDERAEGYFLEYSEVENAFDRYISNEVDARNEYAAPVLARDLHDLPTTTMVTCEFDPLRDEGREYADRLSDVGVDVESINYDQMFHGFLGFPEAIDRCEKAFDDMAEELRTLLN